MNGRSSRWTIATIVVILLWSLGDVALGINDDEEVTRLAELTQWKAGTVVADIGAGDGTYSFAAAEKIGPSGRVYASEIDKNKLKNLKAEVAKRKLENIVIVEGTAVTQNFRRVAATRFFYATYITILRGRGSLITIWCAR
jgi:ubiquinone/menaquinone biosynthesis C-methylase UbiE